MCVGLPHLSLFVTGRFSLSGFDGVCEGNTRVTVTLDGWCGCDFCLLSLRSSACLPIRCSRRVIDIPGPVTTKLVSSLKCWCCIRRGQNVNDAFYDQIVLHVRHWGYDGRKKALKLQ